MSSAPTVPSIKQAFVATQTNLLTQPVAPSRAWRASNDASEKPLPDRIVDEAVNSLNNTIQQHSRRVYAPQATRNIAEQISNAYSRDAERKLGGSDDVEGGIGRELDLVDEKSIDALPPAWTSEKDTNAYPMEATRYGDTVRQLAELNQQRRELRRSVERLRLIRDTIQPLRTTDNGAGIQENLATRDGPVEKELEKMRFLVARVAGRVSELPATSPSRDTGNIELDALTEARKRRIEEFLADANVFPS